MSADLPRWRLGIEEASALGLRREPKSRTIELLALGDSSRIVVGLRPDATGRLATDEPADAYPVEGLPDAAMLTSHRELHQLAEWKFADPKPPSLNDLVVHAGRLYVISSDDRCIIRVQLPIEPDVERIRLDGRWPLPKGIGSGSDAKAEGLLVDDRLGVLVCVDAHSTGHSLYQVRRSVADLIR